MIKKINKENIYFGDRFDELFPKSDSLQRVLLNLKNKLNIQDLIFARQVHGVDALVIRKNNSFLHSFKDGAYKKEFIFEELNVFSQSADIVISDKLNLGVGILTADCLPVLVIDNAKKVFAAIHAGWKGSVLGAARKAVAIMQEEFECNFGDLNIYFGPCARDCCYEVKDDFIETMGELAYIKQRGDKSYFDLVSFNKDQLISLGIKEEQIVLANCSCTICNKEFCSYRREDKVRRQASIVFFK